MRLMKQRIRGFFKNDMRYINSRFTYLLNYLQPYITYATAATMGQLELESGVGLNLF